MTLISCSKKLDMTSEETADSSMEAIVKGMSEEEKAEFEHAIQAVAFEGENLFAMAADPAAAEKRMKERLHGKTAKQIIAESKKLEE